MLKRNRNLVFLDKSDAIRHHFFLLLISIVLIVVLTPVLIFICRLENPILQGVFTLGFQLIMGAFLSRFLYSSGIRAKQSISFLNPSRLGKDWKVHRKNVSIRDVGNFFERLELAVESASGSAEDDVTDIAWFAVAVWSLGSTLLLLIFGITLICSIGAFVLLGIAIISYYAGYALAEIAHSPGEIHQIEYLVTTHLEYLNAKLPNSTKYAIEWREKRNKKVAQNIIVETQLSSEIIVLLKLSIQHPIGEEIIIKISGEFDQVLSKIEEMVKKAKDWKLEARRREGEIVLKWDMEQFKMAMPSSHIFMYVDSSPTKVMLNSILLEISTA
ncbi:hypothetical protein EU537_03450 [Candidatus Thorarchaeota archaeon]|nr:MAG: hypothetical protein EU537_03450 [Candidatus Thorarchaeota archaeon]